MKLRPLLPLLMLPLAAWGAGQDAAAPIVQSPQSVRPQALPPPLPLVRRPAAAPAPPLDSHLQLSYTVGYDVGHNLIGAGPYVDHAALLQGLEDSWQRREPRYPEGAMRQAMIDVATQLRTPRAATPQGGDTAARFCYALGNSIGDKLYPAQERLDLPALEQAIADGLDNKPPRVDDATRATLSADLQKDLAERRRRLAALNQRKSDEFLAANGKQPGVQVTSSGLQYQVLKQGSGPRPGNSGIVSLNYSGSLVDGKVFDDEHRHGQPPARLPLDQVLAGLTEGLRLMPAGSRYRFWLPPALAYGELGAGMKVGPSQVLVFEVELLKVE